MEKCRIVDLFVEKVFTVLMSTSPVYRGYVPAFTREEKGFAGT